MAAGAARRSVSALMQTVDRRDLMTHRTGRRDKADRVRLVRPAAASRDVVATGTRRAS
jgi:hypothetical protein